MSYKRGSSAVLLTNARAFIVANIVTHLPQRDDIARDAKADAPDLGPERARSNIIGYIFGVTPGLAIWVVFGLTRDFRQIMYETFVPRFWRRRALSRASAAEAPWEYAGSRRQTGLSGVVVDSGIPLEEFGTKRRDTAGASPLTDSSSMQASNDRSRSTNR